MAIEEKSFFLSNAAKKPSRSLKKQLFTVCHKNRQRNPALESRYLWSNSGACGEPNGGKAGGKDFAFLLQSVTKPDPATAGNEKENQIIKLMISLKTRKDFQISSKRKIRYL